MQRGKRFLRNHPTANNEEEISASERLCKVMRLKRNIRNVCVAAHVGHGKSTLIDSIVAGDVRMTDTSNDEDEAERGITTKLAAVSLCHEVAEVKLRSLKESHDGNDFLINLIDTPGHADLSYEVTAALRLADGVLIIVDCVEGVRVQTENVIRQAINEQIRPVLIVNKVDKCLVERQMDGEDFYQTLHMIIENANAIISTYEDPLLVDVMFHPSKGTVAFTSGLNGWSFTLSDFAKMFNLKFGVSEDTMIERLWGENYFDPLTRKWTKYKTRAATCKRGFVYCVFEPIKKIINLCLKNDKDTLCRLLTQLGVTLNFEGKDLSCKQLIISAMQAWLPASKSLLEVIIFQLPSPHTAQEYRAEYLYEGPLDDAYATGIKQCDPDSHLMLHVSKLIPVSEKGGYVAVGRVLAGKVLNGMEVRIMGPAYIPGERGDLYVKEVVRTLVWMGKKFQIVEGVPCGNLVALVGLDNYIGKSATLTNVKEINAYPICALKFSVAPVVRVAVECKIALDLPKLVEGLKLLSKSDLMVICTNEESGERIVSGVSEFHIELCLKELDNLMGGVEIVKSDPIVSYRETVLEKSHRTMICKSQNRHNSFFMEASPLEEGIVFAIDEGLVGPRDVSKVGSMILRERFGWETRLTKRIWCFGPETNGSNMLLDMTKGPRYLSEVKELIIDGFQMASYKGVLAEEKMRGICFELCDVLLHADGIHRNGAQVIQTARKLMHASQLAAKPRLLEPVYLVDIQCLEAALGGIYSVVHKRRGRVFEATQMPGSPLYNVWAHLPVAESFGFSGALSDATSGQAFPHCVFSHWNMVPGDPLVTSSQAGKIVGAIRKRKGLKEKIPLLSELEEL